jgi:hypothetical protein
MQTAIIQAGAFFILPITGAKHPVVGKAIEILVVFGIGRIGSISQIITAVIKEDLV